MRTIAFLLALALSATVHAEKFKGLVTHVTDGDTLWVRPSSGGPPLPIRLDGIDAPEICQAFGTDSRDALAARVLHQRVVISSRAHDGYDRTIGRIQLDGEDLGGWMVLHGYAWSYRFRGHPGPYARQESSARVAELGLWRSGAPQPPREFRQRHGSCK
jgi:micrococcal nuclease